MHPRLRLALQSDMPGRSPCSHPPARALPGSDNGPRLQHTSARQCLGLHHTCISRQFSLDLISHKLSCASSPGSFQDPLPHVHGSASELSVSIYQRCPSETRAVIGLRFLAGVSNSFIIKTTATGEKHQAD